MILKIRVYLTDAVGNAKLCPEALQLIKFLIRIPHLPAIKINHTDRTITGVDDISRMEISMKIYRLFLPYLIYILSDIINHCLILFHANL